MKKIFVIFALILIVSGCGTDMMNTPTKKVEKLLSSYQTLDEGVLNDLDDVVLNSDDLNDDQKSTYTDLMKKHYQNLRYKIKEEEVNGDTATVTVEIEVDDYNKVLKDANDYSTNNRDEFLDDDNNYDKSKFIDYQLKKLSEASDTVKYTLDIKTIKVEGIWQVEPLSSDDLDKINGTYRY